MRLSELSAGKDNNLNLLRLCAASAVLFSHSFALSTGSPGSEPLRATVGMSLGSIAVDVFFLVSGFLVTGSLWRSRSLVDFALARALRIFPALLVMLAITVIGLGLALTTAPWQDYLQSRQTHVYLIKGATLFAGVMHHLPGVFETNPFPSAVNGSLWTLPYEVRMYAILAIAWLVCRQLTRRLTVAFSVACVGAAAIAVSMLLARHATNVDDGRFLWLFYMFFAGASVHVLRDRIRLDAKFALLAALVLVVVAATWSQAFAAAYFFALPYLTFYLAYGPSGPVRSYNRVGDFSYGVYIYAFPTQQAVVHFWPGISPLNLFAGSGLITLAFAMASWFLVEKHALALKGRWVATVMQRLGYERNGGTWRRSRAIAGSVGDRP